MLNFKIVESQKLIFSKGPVVAADTTNLEAKFEVNDLFDGTLRAYWNVRGSVVDSFKVDLDTSGICTIPSEVLASISDPSMYGDIDHILQVSVVSIGKDDTIRTTSTTCEIPVYKSSYSGNVSQPSKPSGDGSVTNIITGAAINGEQMDFYNGNNVIFSTPLANLKNFLLPIAGGTMQGNINMDGHAITGLPNAVNDTDALALAYAKTLFAPSGYGLGGLGGKNLTTQNELDSATNNGWYIYTSDTGFSEGGLTIKQGFMFVISRSANHVVQIFKPTSPNRETLLIRYLSGGSWGEWEWLNPPMVLGVEYRTTERYNGNPVYTKLINCGTLTSGRNVITHALGSNVIGFRGDVGGHALPYYDPDYNGQVGVAISQNSLVINASSQFAGKTAYVQLWYVKG